MKRPIAALLAAAVAVLLLTVSVSAESYSVNGVRFSLPEEFVLLTENNLSSHGDEVKALGHTAASLKNTMREKGIFAVAVTESNSEQFLFRVSESEFTAQVGSFANLDESAAEAVNRELFAGKATRKTVNGDLYFVTVTHTEGAGFKTYQYATVKNGLLYSFSYYGTAEGRMTELMSGLRVIEDSEAKSAGEIASLVGVILIMVIALVAMFFIGASVVRDIREGEAGDSGETLVIKRRRK